MSTLDELYPLLPPVPSRRPRNGGRPNYNQIHAKPLPLTTYPLPPLIPHNPLSLLQIAYTYISHFISPPSSHPSPRIRGYYSCATNAIDVTDPLSIRVLWEHGFFGKGSLSRSEPTWLDRERKRLGLLATDTSEEITAARRNERKRFKKERARKEREAIEEKLLEESMQELLVEKIATAHIRGGGGGGGGGGGKPTLRSKYEGLAEAALLSPTKGIGFFRGERMLPTPPATPSPEPILEDASEKEKSNPVINGRVNAPQKATVDEDNAPQPAKVETQEHLQLTPEEAFFLTYALGILDVYPEPTSSFPPSASEETPTDLTTTSVSLPSTALPPSALLALFTSHPSPPPNAPFLLLYATYHHFRSLGWVVRPGLKFGVDYLLYLRGPVFSHAEFAVTVLPAYTHSFWATEQGREMRRDSSSGGEDEAGSKARSWHWLHCVQRVQSQVRKTLVVCWVDVPPPLPLARDGSESSSLAPGSEIGGEGGVTALLKRYKVREMVMKRWIPNRSRD